MSNDKNHIDLLKEVVINLEKEGINYLEYFDKKEFSEKALEKIHDKIKNKVWCNSLNFLTTDEIRKFTAKKNTHKYLYPSNFEKVSRGVRIKKTFITPKISGIDEKTLFNFLKPILSKSDTDSIGEISIHAFPNPKNCKPTYSYLALYCNKFGLRGYLEELTVLDGIKKVFPDSFEEILKRKSNLEIVKIEEKENVGYKDAQDIRFISNSEIPLNSNRETQIISNYSEITKAQFEERIQFLEKRIREQDEQIKRKDDQIAMKDELIIRKDDQLIRKDDQIAILQNKMNSKIKNTTQKNKRT